MDYIPLEKPLADIELKIKDLCATLEKGAPLTEEIKTLKAESVKVTQEIFKDLNAYQTIQISRHPQRPNTMEIINKVFKNFIELHGDRRFLDDKAIIGGIAKFNKRSVMVLGHQKGRGTKDNIFRNFGMPRPEGYRKALRLMSTADRFNLPIITFIDTPGAYPGVGAEERGQSEAIANNILVMSRLKTPIISIVVGEGGSGGALGIAVANKVHMLKYAVYSVISPEGCASILMKDARRASEAAEALKIKAKDSLDLGVIDSIIDEPIGGAHRDLDKTAANIARRLSKDFKELDLMDSEGLRKHRRNKFMNLGKFTNLST